ncbi:MAG: mechanosensitive ion channel [Tenuifilaceae bacterium]|jgi:small conductance mechanosensitive channel|uniref:mechanosensitive ion channel family protein n=1 Tax=Perlabentimonas gracilis TaxID=2715279 RepID=UPI0014082404|nr:mechanosensitive ion channel domain-containing protein [Perlabentimonas gracilis]MDX9769144.1 mechanosensitive ion channel [Tenuifilaceae bacterium]NHB68353.1 mechanosensitive ion channel [Perlabentimonas gracilis]
MEDITSMMPSTDLVIDLAITYGGKILLAIVTLLVGLWLIKKLSRVLRRTFEKRSFDKSLQTFLVSFVGITLKILLVISVISMVGVQMTSFIALLGAAGLAFGMALSGTLQNFAGGVMILVLKPFKVGDYIEAQGFAGSVKEIQIFHTILNTPDKKLIVIPNGGLSTGSLINYSAEPIRRVDWTFGIGYSDDIDKAKAIISQVITSDERALKDPEPFFGVISLGDSSVNIVARVWVEAANYWPLFFAMNEAVKKEFDKQGVSIPFPQRDVHIYQAK